MTTALSRLLEMLRSMVIVVLSVASGIAVALTTRNVEEAWLEIIAFFMIFVTPMIVAWLLFRIIPSFCRNTKQCRNAATPGRVVEAKEDMTESAGLLY